MKLASRDPVLKTVLMTDRRYSGGTPLVCSRCATLVRVVVDEWPRPYCQSCASQVLEPFTYMHWHAWQGTGGVMLSNEMGKELQEFKTPDACIDWLYGNGFKLAARALSNHLVHSPETAGATT